MASDPVSRAVVSAESRQRNEEAEEEAEEDWNYFFEQPQQPLTSATLSVLSAGSWREAEAILQWQDKFAELVRRARRGSPCRNSQWWYGQKSDLKHAKEDKKRRNRKWMPPAKKAALEELEKLISTNEEKAREKWRSEGGKRSQASRKSRKETGLKSVAAAHSSNITRFFPRKQPTPTDEEQEAEAADEGIVYSRINMQTQPCSNEPEKHCDKRFPKLPMFMFLIRIVLFSIQASTLLGRLGALATWVLRTALGAIKLRARGNLVHGNRWECGNRRGSTVPQGFSRPYLFVGVTHYGVDCSSSYDY